jgi:hypothetical protein
MILYIRKHRVSTRFNSLHHIFRKRLSCNGLESIQFSALPQSALIGFGTRRPGVRIADQILSIICSVNAKGRRAKDLHHRPQVNSCIIRSVAALCRKSRKRMAGKPDVAISFYQTARFACYCHQVSARRPRRWATMTRPRKETRPIRTRSWSRAGIESLSQGAEPP